MKFLALLFAVFLILGSAAQAYACGAGNGPKDGDDIEAMES